MSVRSSAAPSLQCEKGVRGRTVRAFDLGAPQMGSLSNVHPSTARRQGEVKYEYERRPKLQMGADTTEIGVISAVGVIDV